MGKNTPKSYRMGLSPHHTAECPKLCDCFGLDGILSREWIILDLDYICLRILFLVLFLDVMFGLAFPSFPSPYVFILNYWAMAGLNGSERSHLFSCLCHRF